MESRKGEIITGILLGKASSNKKAKSIAKIYSKCPYNFYYEIRDNIIIGIFSIPMSHKWWLEWVVESPEDTLGLRSVDVFFTEEVIIDSRWSDGKIKYELIEAPCGANCSECFRYKKDCERCPDTIYYIEF